MIIFYQCKNLCQDLINLYLRKQLIVGCIPDPVFLFSVTQVLVGLLRQFCKHVFPTCAHGAHFNNNN